MDTSMLGRINALRRMTVAELRDEWFRSFGEPARSSNRDHLWRRLAWRVQELAHGGLSDRAKGRLDELAQRTSPVAWNERHGPKSRPRVGTSRPMRKRRVPSVIRVSRRLAP